jgi:hypothetical protein
VQMLLSPMLPDVSSVLLLRTAFALRSSTLSNFPYQLYSLAAVAAASRMTTTVMIIMAACTYDAEDA